MTKLELINKSFVGVVAHISSDTKLESLEQYINTNKEIFDNFKGIIVAANYVDMPGLDKRFNSLILRHHEIWLKYYPDVKFIDLDENRSHTFGTLDLDGAVFDYCKENDIEWLFKVNDDMLFTPEFLEDEELPEADFYYWNGIGIGGMKKYEYDNDRMIKEDYYPQTTIYFINTTKLPELHNKQVVTDGYNYCMGLENYNGKVWEVIEGFTCEDFLKNATIKNKLVKHHMTKPTTYIRLLNFIKANHIADCSHKQLIIDGFVHLQWPDQKCIII